MGRDLACSRWTLERLGTMKNQIQVRGQTDQGTGGYFSVVKNKSLFKYKNYISPLQATYRRGVQYCMHECTLADYVSDLVTDHPRSKSRYLAALNIKRALPEIADESHIAPFVDSHKIHAGPFLWLARNGHYESGIGHLFETTALLYIFNENSSKFLRTSKDFCSKI